MVVIRGVGLGGGSMKKVRGLEAVLPWSPLFETTTSAVPGREIDAALMVAVTVPGLTTEVGCGTPFQNRVEVSLRKPLPRTVSVKLGPPAVARGGCKEDSVTRVAETKLAVTFLGADIERDWGLVIPLRSPLQPEKA